MPRLILRAALAAALLSPAAVGQEDLQVLEAALVRRLEAAEGKIREGRYSQAVELARSARELFAATGAREERLGELDLRLEEVRAAAARLLEEKGDAVTGEPGESLRERVERLVLELGDPAWGIRERATRELSELGDEAVPRLEKALEDEDPEVRYRAGAILESIRTRVPGRPFHCQLGIVVWVAEGRAWIDIGAAEGLAAGAKGVSFRPGEFGARLVAAEIREDWASVEIGEPLGGGTVRPGDLAEFSAEFDR